MAGGDIKGIGVKVTGDATGIKKAFDEAVGGLSNKTIQMKLSVVKDASVARVLNEIRSTKVSVDVALHPTRETIRGIRKDFGVAMAREGGMMVPIKIKTPSLQEGTRIKQAIVRSIGTPEITVILNPQWAGGGSAAGIFGGTGGGGGGGSVAGAPTRAAAAPTAPQTAGTAPRTRTGVSSHLATFQRQADEAQTEWENRLLQSRVVLLQRANTANKQQTRTKAAKALAEIDKQLGATPITAVLDARGTNTIARREDAPRRPNRGGLISPNVGEPTGPTDWEKVARVFYQNVARRQLSTPAFVGGEFPQEGLDPGTGRFRALSGRFISRSAFQENRRGRDRGQRAQMSFLQPGLDLTPEEQETRRGARVERVAAGRTASPMDELVRTIKGMPFSFGDAFDKGLASLKAGDVAGALGKHVGPGEPGSGVRGALDQLLARGRSGQIPGVGPRTVSNALDPTREIRPGPHAEAQSAFVLEAQVLQSLQGAIMEGQTQATAAAPASRPRRGQRGRVAAARARAAAAGPMSAEEVAAVMARPGVGAAPSEPEIVAPAAPAAPAGQVLQFPHLAVAAGGAASGGGGPFFGAGGGGPVPVEVMNWPGGFEQGGSVAAGPVMPASADFERMFQDATENITAASAKLGIATPGTKGKGKTVPVPAKAHLTGTPRTEALRAVQAGTLTPEQAEAITNPPRTAAPSGLDVARQQVEEQLAQARQGLPIRGFATSIAQLAAGGGRGKITARFQRASDLLTQAGGFATDTERLNKLQAITSQQLTNINAKKEAGTKLNKREIELLSTLPGKQKEIGDQIEKNNIAQKGLTDEASNLAKLTGGEKLTNIGKSLIGSIGGTLAFGTALGAVTAGLAAAGAAALPVIDRLTGYQNATKGVTDALADQTKASGGAAKQTVAQAAAQTNLNEVTFNSIKDALDQRAAVEAGNKAFEEQIKFVAAGRNVAQQQQQSGLPKGVDPGLFRTTGGFNALGIQTPFFGQRPYEELLREQIGQIPSQTAAKQGNSPIFGLFGKPEYNNTTEAQRLAQRDKILGSTLEDLGHQFEGTGIKWVKSTDKMAASTDVATKALVAAGIQLSPSQLADEGLSISKESAGLTTPKLQLAIAKAQEREQRPDAGVLLQALQERAIPALKFGIEQGLKNQLQIFTPAARGIAGLAQPQPAFGRSIVPLTNFADQTPFNLPQSIRGRTNLPNLGGVTGLGGQFGGVPPEAIASFARYRDEAQRAIDAVNAKAAEGEQVLRDKLHVPESTIVALRGFGQRIDEISQQQSNLRLDLQYSQYNRQLFVARRTLGDIAGLIGKGGATQIGVLEREQLLLGRRSQALGLQGQQLSLQTGQLQQQSAIIGQQANALQIQLSQRQINFQRSVAGFTAPGVTPEERAARIEEAKIEADYAQKQLDFQKSQFAIQEKQVKINETQLGYQREAYELAKAQFENQVALQDATNTRSYQDQIAAIQELQKAFQTGVEIAALDELKAAIGAQRDQLVETLNTQVGAEEDFIKSEAQFAQDLISQTGNATKTIVNQVATVFSQIRAMAPWFFGGSGGGGGYTGSDFTKQREGGNAAGLFGQVTQPTALGYAGEAGKEMVAIIRNPRPMPLGVSGGGSGGGSGGVSMPIYITISGNSVRDDRDLDELASRVGRIVETNMGRRASQFGFRVTR